MVSNRRRVRTFRSSDRRRIFHVHSKRGSDTMNLTKSLAGAAAALIVIPSLALSAHWSLDTVHSEVSFKIRHLGISKVVGNFRDFSGHLDFNPEDLSTMKVEATVQTASIDTDNDDRDKHLRSDEFFNVETYPTMTFTSKKVTDVKGDSFKLHGDLTIHGVTKPVVFDVEYNGMVADPWGNTKSGLSAETKINRKDFGLTWNQALETGGLLVGEDVTISLEVEATQEKGNAEKGDM
jgi:polyisoprenoid-binding protein YceI